MKSFIKNSILFLSPFLIIFIFLELYIELYPSAYVSKARYIKQNKDIELLILGSSHSQNDINPEFINIKSANLAYANQDQQLNSALFFRYIESLSNLKCLIWELDYHNLEYKVDDTGLRLPWYYKYHGIRIGKLNYLYKYLLYPSSPEFFNNFILSTLTQKHSRDILNEYGFITNDFNGWFADLNNDEEIIITTAHDRLEYLQDESIENYVYNTKQIDKVIEYCNNNDILVILLTMPVYKSFISVEKTEKNKRRTLYIDEVLSKYSNIAYLNYEKDNRFVSKIDYFKNDDHLNSYGAKIFTEILNNDILDLINKFITSLPKE